ncbi:uncharacterized protein LOC123534525 [Mercenaria mercenaria]|uniref:uncharacterized protein LOC123534525 n=1 Tax=Mercenaria mercenaria TaxID=6596 RepID=UPI00234E487B|nr:uncharacterized protein LOC123534525 [Mercenaria mercenaria]
MNVIMKVCELQRSRKRQESDRLISGIPCCESLHNKWFFNVIVFLTIVVFDAADLISDWLLYKDIAGIEKGLVYGPPGESLCCALLAFCIIGTITITFETLNLWSEIFRDNPFINVDIPSLITVWIEDVPQITINVYLVACREEAISYFQLVKASMILICTIIKFVIYLTLFCRKRSQKHNTSTSLVVCRVIMMIGLLITFAGAVVVFCFAQHERDRDGKLHFKTPQSIFEGKYDDAKYFNNVSIYFSHKLFDWNERATSPAEKRNLLRLFTIDDIRQENVDRTIKIQYDHVTGPSKVVIIESDESESMRVNECFQMDRTGINIITGSNCTAYITSSINEFVFKFRYIKPYSPKLIFGDIRYNIKVKYSSVAQCKFPDFILSNNISDQSNGKEAALHYYRTMSSHDETNHVIHTSATDGTFYHSGSMEDISDVWKTGFAHCKSTGSLAPHHDVSIDVPCT